MKKIVDDERLIYKVCCLYYNDNMNQMEIGDYLGIPEKADHTLFKAGYATQRELRTLAECGAVGDVALQFYDEEGNAEKFHFFNDRVASMQLDMIRKIPVKIGIAGGGKKVHSVIGAIHGGFINVLITNAECARELIRRM